MHNPATVANTNLETSHPFEATRFLGRYPAQVQRIQERVEGERTLLTLALATFQAELAAKAA